MPYSIESAFYHNELICIVIMTDMGHRCGYVGLKKDHPLFGVHYSQDIRSPELLQELQNSKIGKRGIIPLFCWDGESTSPELLFDVHGGITYSSSGNYPMPSYERIWWFGFDCAHSEDGKDWAARKRMLRPKDYERLWDVESRFPLLSQGTIRSKEYVERECKNLAQQLSCVGDLLKETRAQITA